ncbi:carbon-nitrogen hydrolase family protein [Ammonicoccus fulvus]|uniref:Carbon-nitrogen hydrolase family protein n=1 Tax=Ammonicoccus fulvus TaxID=3138240 RepID=A0ABZ3FR31_9ACTN
MRIALAQICATREVEDNLEQVRTRVAEAAKGGARLVVFPEATMRAFGHNLDSIAEPVDGPFAQAIADLARTHDLTVAVGLFTPGGSTESDRPKVRNTLLVAQPDGVRHYDKIHLYDAFGFAESDTVEAGAEELRVMVDGVSIGMTICYDIRFPQLFINHARAGAQVIVVAASWGAGPEKIEQWQLLARARALDSTSWVLACGQADPQSAGVEAKQGAPTGVGHSLVVSPTGRVIASAGAAPQLLLADLDLDLVAQTRRTLPVLDNARLS